MAGGENHLILVKNIINFSMRKKFALGAGWGLMSVCVSSGNRVDSRLERKQTLHYTSVTIQ